MKLIDLTGQVFGRWTVLGRGAKSRFGKWRCQCACGTVRDVVGSTLRGGQSVSCGCYQRNARLAVIDLTGQQFGRWTVLREVGRFRKARWLCRCICGTERAVQGDYLRAGRSVSCGCYHAEVFHRRTHGATEGRRTTREYNTWRGAKGRCYDPKHRSYPDYGGRGITMDERWRASFPTFRADMGMCPLGFTLDRIDNNGPYAPGNCRWVSRAEQNANRSR